MIPERVQVIVIGPNGARTTANKTPMPDDPIGPDGKPESEYDRLLRGAVPGREGYKDADKINYDDEYGGHTTGEAVTGDYKGDYGGEDASTPENERESVVGAGNTGYDTKDYSTNDEGEVVITNEDGSPYTGFDYGRFAAEGDVAPIPTGAEFWNVNGEYYIVYFIPGSGIPVYYDSSLEDLKNIFGPVEFPEVESSIKTPSSEQWSKAIRFGDALELSDPNIYDPSQSPWVSFIDTIAKEAAIRPWLYNEEMVELLAEATLEGRTVSDAEWQSTEWWRGSTQKQRNWFLLSQSASGEFVKGLPADAKAKIEDDRIRIRNSMQQAGISNPSDELVNWVAEQFTTGGKDGVWTDIYTDDQIKVLADQSIDIALDTDLDNFITSGSIDYETTREGESFVRNLAKEEMGPVFGGNISYSQINIWSGMVRNDKNAEIKIRESMKNMMRGIFGETHQEGLTYEEIATPWRGFTTNVWGGTLDETSNLFQDVLKANDVSVANQLLFDAGLQDGGSKKIQQDVLNSLVGSFGPGVRRML